MQSIIKLFLLCVLFVGLIPFSYAAESHEAQYIQIRCNEDTSTATAVGLVGFGDSSGFTQAEVDQAKRVMFQTEGDDARWRDDGTAPTATVGFVQTADNPPFWYAADPNDIQFIEESTATDIFVCLYK